MFPWVFQPVVAQTDEEAEYLATSAYQRVLGLMRGQSLKLKAPVETMEGIWSPAEKVSVDNFMRWDKLVRQKPLKPV